MLQAELLIAALKHDDTFILPNLADQGFRDVAAALHLRELIRDRRLCAHKPDRGQRPRQLLHVCSSPSQEAAALGATSRGRMMAAAITNRQSPAKACSIVAKPPRS